MNGPPTKRLRGLDVGTAAACNDPFGDDDEFTQEDLNEIDIIASQALTSAGLESKSVTKVTEPAHGSTWSLSAGLNKPLSRAGANQSRENTSGFNRGSAGKSSREPLGKVQQQFGSDRDSGYRLLEAQHAELKRKLKEVEEEILLKSGEIRVLRDTLKAAQQEKDAQRQNQVLLETQRQKEQNEREKELNRKVQSLQTELEFKEAEISDMKTKLLSSDKNKMHSPLVRNSPKVLSTLAQLHHGSTSPCPIGNGFITKEAFGVPTSSRATPGRTPVKPQRYADGGGASSTSEDGHETSHIDPFLSVRPACLQHRCGVLLGLLLQQPLSPGSLSIPHLLSMSLTDYSQLSSGPQPLCDPLDRTSPVGAALNLVQSLATTGLSMLTQNQTSTTAASSRSSRSCSGAVLLLPLLDLHLTQLCRNLDSLCSSSAGSSGSDSPAADSHSAGQSVSSAARGKQEDVGLSSFSVEDTGLTALRLLSLLLAHSDEVMEAVLLRKTQNTDNKTDHFAAHMGLCSQNALLQSLLRLCDTRLCSNSSQKKELVLNALKTLCVLIKRTPHTHADRLECVLQVVCVCLSADITVQPASECVSVLTAMSDHQKLVKQLCSQHDPCVFLRLFHLIRTRPDSQAPHMDLILLDLQVVRLLSRLTQSENIWMNNVQNICPCSPELVQTVVIISHRQWLDLRGSQEPAESATGTLHESSSSRSPWWITPAAALLRESLLLLHWLLLHHGSFSESCRPLLHMYDQMVPAVRETLRKIPALSESEELALEEICRSEGDDTDDMDTDTGS